MRPDIARFFPAHFVWGAATAAYQIEGAVNEDGRGESIWDRFCATPGKVRNGETGAVACDFYHRYPEDIALMRELGLGGFRFSIAWSRILPEGTGRVNQEGLDFYDRVVDELLAAGIEPFVTLYHWDLPQALEDRGGWPARETVDAFAAYVEVVAARLGDRVRSWLTHNEPQVAAGAGYWSGEHAPGRSNPDDAIAASHHLLLSHGRALEILRRDARDDAQIGIALNLHAIHPASDAEGDIAAAREKDGRDSRWYLDPVFRGEYPADIDAEPPVRAGDLEAISAPIDFLGMNYYFRTFVAAGGKEVRPDAPRTDMGWEIYPDGIYEVLMRLRDEYAPTSIYITESGAAFPDVRVHDGAVRDPEREAYLASHIEEVGRAIQDGVPVRGYFVWTLMDNFEWAYGYSKRFGLVYVDYPTLERVPKGSFEWYRALIARHADVEAG